MLALVFLPPLPLSAQQDVPAAEAASSFEKAQAAAKTAVQAKIALETSESLFAVLASINLCGYESELSVSHPMRQQIRREIAAAASSPAAAASRDALCKFYAGHRQPDASRELAQYVSLGIVLGPPPAFELTTRQLDLPPDALRLLDFVPLLRDFYAAAGLGAIWQKHQPGYEQLLAGLHEPVAGMIRDTDIYLRLPLSNFLGRRFIVFVDPLAAPGQVNARNYDADYFMVISPGSPPLKIDQLRHTYLHFVLDPLALKRNNAIKRLEPLLRFARSTPVDDAFKNDAALMVTESLIRAIEARTLSGDPDPRAKGKEKEQQLGELEQLRSARAQESLEQGYVLTRAFYDQLAEFDKGVTGFRDAFGDMLAAVSLTRESKRLSSVTFASEASPELVEGRSRSPRSQMLDLAEEMLSQRDGKGAYSIARQVLDQRSGDPARAMFILARAATMNQDMDSAQLMFERTLEVASEPSILAWSHIMLARILDLKCNRSLAVNHYKAALSAGDASPEIRSAADRGISQAPSACEDDPGDDR